MGAHLLTGKSLETILGRPPQRPSCILRAPSGFPRGAGPPPRPPRHSPGNLPLWVPDGRSASTEHFRCSALGSPGPVRPVRHVQAPPGGRPSRGSLGSGEGGAVVTVGWGPHLTPLGAGRPDPGRQTGCVGRASCDRPRREGPVQGTWTPLRGLRLQDLTPSRGPASRHQGLRPQSGRSTRGWGHTGPAAPPRTRPRPWL